MKKYLVIGNPIQHSLSPKLHNYWIKKNNIDASYDKKKINDDPDIMKHNTVTVNFGQTLMKARMAAKMTQKELAQKMNVKIAIIKSYESAKAIPNPRIISNLERHLNCKLPRKK